MKRSRRQQIVYVALLVCALGVALTASFTSLGAQIDEYAYDWFFRIYQPRPWQTETVLLAIDEATFGAFGGLAGVRKPLAAGLELLAGAKPKAVAVDIILSDPGDPAMSARLENAMRATPNLVLACDILEEGRSWELPRPEFRRWAAALGHVHGEPRLDAVSREMPLEKVAGNQRYWALSLQAFALSRAASIVASPDELQVGDTVIPARYSAGRTMRIRYVPPSMSPIPRIGLKQLIDHPRLAARFTGKTVFVGVTAQGQVRDVLMTPYSAGKPMPGLEIQANAFETMAQGRFITTAPDHLVVGFALLLAAASGLVFAFFPSWIGAALSVVILAVAHVTPYWAFTQESVFSFVAPVSTSWACLVTAGVYQYLTARRNLRKAESDRARYQQTLHFVTHEMRTPLTAIQGSSELMSRYALPEEKRKQFVNLINSESRRLARMVEMFLNVERLSAGQMELKRETFAVESLVDVCLERARPLAERKQITVTVEPVPGDLALTGDRELMEYAFYNLLTNAIKYSPQRTEVTVHAARQDERVKVAVKDQGIGMDQKEVRKIFQKFYRTRSAEQSGEAGTGIGLSIVEQIVVQHGGAIEVSSQPGKGSCFTLVLPVPVSSPVEKH